MNHWQTMLHVILPQALRNIIPQIGNNFIINIKDTSVLSVISITDLFFVHKSVVGALYTYFESATIVMVIYLTMTLFASYLLRLWEKALDGPQNYDLNTTDSLAYTSGMYNAPDPNHESQNLDMKRRRSPCLSLLSRCATSPRASAPMLFCVTWTLPSTRAT